MSLSRLHTVFLFGGICGHSGYLENCPSFIPFKKKQTIKWKCKMSLILPMYKYLSQPRQKIVSLAWSIFWLMKHHFNTLFCCFLSSKHIVNIIKRTKKHLRKPTVYGLCILFFVNKICTIDTCHCNVKIFQGYSACNTVVLNQVKCKKSLLFS